MKTIELFLGGKKEKFVSISDLARVVRNLQTQVSDKQWQAIMDGDEVQTERGVGGYLATQEVLKDLKTADEAEATQVVSMVDVKAVFEDRRQYLLKSSADYRKAALEETNQDDAEDYIRWANRAETKILEGARLLIDLEVLAGN